MIIEKIVKFTRNSLAVFLAWDLSVKIHQQFPKTILSESFSLSCCFRGICKSNLARMVFCSERTCFEKRHPFFSSQTSQRQSVPNRGIWLRFVIRIAYRKSLAIWDSVKLLRKAHCSDLLYKKLALRFEWRFGERFKSQIMRFESAIWVAWDSDLVGAPQFLFQITSRDCDLRFDLEHVGAPTPNFIFRSSWASFLSFGGQINSLQRPCLLLGSTV